MDEYPFQKPEDVLEQKQKFTDKQLDQIFNEISKFDDETFNKYTHFISENYSINPEKKTYHNVSRRTIYRDQLNKHLRDLMKQFSEKKIDKEEYSRRLVIIYGKLKKLNNKRNR